MIARTRKPYRSALAALLLGLAAAAILSLVPRSPQPLIVQAGAEGPFLADGETARLRNVFGFHTPEGEGASRFRWTSGEASFVVRSGERLGAPLLRLRLCGCRVDDSPAPQLRLRLNGMTVADTHATARWGEWRRYAILAGPPAAPYSPDLLVELLSDRTTHPESGKPLGVAFAWARLDPLAAVPRAYDLATALGLGMLCGGLALVARRATLRAGILAAAIGLGATAAQGALYHAQPLPPELLALGLLVSLALALRLGDSLPHRVGLAIALGALVAAPQILGFWMLDDSFISLRYARNALLGHGFVFNPGERVEGYTNFLWTALFVPLLASGAPPAPAAQTITLLLALAIAALAWVGARRVAGPAAALAATALLALSAPFVLYTARGSGMETALFTLLLLGGALAYLRAWEAHGWWRFALAGTLLALAAMTRPEGVLVAGVTGLHLLLGIRHKDVAQADARLSHAALTLRLRSGQAPPPPLPLRQARESRETANSAWKYLGIHAFSALSIRSAARLLASPDARLLALLAGFMAIFAPYYLWRLTYYGYPLPNTFYAKVGGTSAQALRGLGYAAGFAAAQAPLLALALLGMLRSAEGSGPSAEGAEGSGKRGRRTEGGGQGSGIRKPFILHPSSFILHPSSFESYLGLIVGVYTLYIMLVGGDHFPLYRFFVPLVPLLALLAARGLARLTPIGRYTLLLVTVVGMAWQLPYLVESGTLNTAGQVWGENSVVEKNREIGLWLRQHTPPGTLIATGIAGALPYYAERPVLDSLGLNDLHIAHLEVPTIGQGVAGSEKTDVAYVLARRPAYIPHNSSGPFQGNPAFVASYELMLVRGPEGRGMRLYRRVDLPAPEGAR